MSQGIPSILPPATSALSTTGQARGAQRQGDALATQGAQDMHDVHDAQEADQARLLEAARQFEAMLAKQLLETASPGAATFGADGEGLGQSQLLAQYHETMAQLLSRSDAFGLGRFLKKQVQAQQAHQA